MSVVAVEAPASKPITDQIEARLKTLDDVTYYRNEVPDHPPTFAEKFGDDGDESDRVAPYVVLYPFPGKAYDQGEQPADWSAKDLDYGCQVTCAAGFSADAEHLVDRVRALLEGWPPVVEGVVVGPLRPPTGYDPGSVQRSGSNVTPPRFWVPLQYRSTATTT